MTNQEYLSQYAGYKKKILKAKESLERQISLIDSLSSNNNGMPRGTGITNKPEQYVIELMNECEKRTTQISAWGAKMCEIEETILRLNNPDYIHVLWGRYIDGLEWDEIARRTDKHYSEFHVRARIHGQALLAIVQPNARK